MAKQKSPFDAGMLPLLLIILIPVGFALYAWWASNQSTAPPTTQTQTTDQPATPADVTSARISLDNPSSLPQSVVAAQFIPFSFSVQNTGDTDGTIPYKVYVKWSTGEEDVIDENVISLAAGASTSIAESLKFEVATETAQVYLELTQTGQTSQFRLPRT